MGCQGGFGEVGDFKVLVEDLAEGDVPGRGLVPFRLPQQPGEGRGGLRVAGACLAESAFLTGDRVLPA